MSISAAVAEPAETEYYLRGSTTRKTNFMELYQEGAFSAIAAAAGCVPSKPPIDEGIDYIVTHRSEHHPHNVATVHVQLKSTGRVIAADADQISVQLTRQRYDLLREANPTVPRILVLMSVPRSRDGWISQRDSKLVLRHSNYWVCLEGQPDLSVKKPTVYVPRAQRFDDMTLMDIMERAGKEEPLWTPPPS